MLGECKGKQICKYVSDYVLFDLETTGISCVYDEIIEISAVKVRNGIIVEEFTELVNPGRSIPISASRVNHIYDNMVASAPILSEVLPGFLDFIKDDILVGHNIHSFDLKFIYRDCEKYLGKTITNDYVDTLKIAKVIFPQMHHRRLGDLAEYYGISTAGAHRALTDCRINQQVFELMGKALRNMDLPAKQECIKKCSVCGNPMIKRSGRFGEFWGCSGYPNCRHTENIC